MKLFFLCVILLGCTYCSNSSSSVVTEKTNPHDTLRQIVPTQNIFIRWPESWGLTRPLMTEHNGDLVVGIKNIYIFGNSNGTWTPKDTLPLGNPAELFNTRIISLDAKNGYIAVAISHSQKNKVLIFRQNGNSWALEKTIESPRKFVDRENTEFGFGSDLAFSGKYLFIGEPLQDQAGRVYIYQNTGNDWTLQGTTDGSGVIIGAQLFGYSLDAIDSSVIIGTPKLGADLYRVNGGVWKKSQEIRKPVTNRESPISPIYSASVKIDENICVISSLQGTNKPSRLDIYTNRNGTLGFLLGFDDVIGSHESSVASISSNYIVAGAGPIVIKRNGNQWNKHARLYIGKAKWISFYSFDTYAFVTSSKVINDTNVIDISQFVLD